jgi:hypothetical protein
VADRVITFKNLMVEGFNTTHGLNISNLKVQFIS